MSRVFFQKTNTIKKHIIVHSENGLNTPFRAIAEFIIYARESVQDSVALFVLSIILTKTQSTFNEVKKEKYDSQTVIR